MPEAGTMRVLVVGAGRCGTAIAAMLAASGDYAVTLADSDENAEARAGGLPFRRIDGSRRDELERALPGFDAVVAATPSFVCPFVAAAAGAAGIAYLDLVDLPEITETAPPGATLIPACGFSPGLVNTIAAGLAAEADGPFDMTVRVGALPLHPTNRLGYGLTWNIDDLIEEYTSGGAAIRDGRPARIAPLEELETLVLDGGRYEAFTTGAATAHLAALLGGRAENFTLKTIRYAGHLELIRFLLDDLGLARRRDHLKVLLQNGLPEVTQDVLVLFITLRTTVKGRRREVSDFRRILHGRAPNGEPLGALQRASAAHVAAMLDLLRTGTVLGGRVVRHESVAAGAVLGNRFVAALGL